MYFYKYKKLMRNLGEGVVMPKSAQIQAKIRLLAAIRSSAEWQEAVFYTQPQIGWQWPAAGIVVLILAIVLGGGSMATVSLAKGSLPGDRFYGVKITMEKAQVNLAFSQAKQAELEMSFAASRLDEVNKLITADGATSQVATNISQAIRHFNSSLDSVQKKLDSAKTQVDKKDAKSLAVAVAKTGSEESLVKLQTKIATIEKKIDQITVNEAALKEARAVLEQTAPTNPEGLSIIKESAKNTEEKAQNIEDVKKILESFKETKALMQATKETVDSILDK